MMMAMAEKRELTAQILGSWGLPALWLRILARPALALSLLVCFAALMLATTRVWEVRIVGAEGAEARKIQSFLAQEG